MPVLRFNGTILKVTLGAAICVMLAACVAITPEPSANELEPAMAESQLYVDSVEVEKRDDEYYAVVSGTYADSCTEVTGVATEERSNGVEVALTAGRPADALCAQVLTPFEEIIPLNIDDAVPGEYTVVVDGVLTTFQVGRSGSGCRRRACNGGIASLH